MESPRSILMLLTSHDRIGATEPTGVWFEEFSTPYRLFTENGYEVTVASTRGGSVPVDPRSRPAQPDAAAEEALVQLEHTLPASELDAGEYAALFIPGGHGTLFDLPENPHVTRLVEQFTLLDRVVGSVCHGPAAFIGPTARDGSPLIRGRRIAAFTNEEEGEAQLDRIVPFLLESRLKELGAVLVKDAPWHDNVVVDGHLVTGQNPQSSGHAAREVIRLLST